MTHFATSRRKKDRTGKALQKLRTKDKRKQCSIGNAHMLVENLFRVVNLSLSLLLDRNRGVRGMGGQ